MGDYVSVLPENKPDGGTAEEVRDGLEFGATCPENGTCELSRISTVLNEGLSRAISDTAGPDESFSGGKRIGLTAVAGTALLLLLRKYSGSERWRLGFLGTAGDESRLRPLICEAPAGLEVSSLLERMRAALREAPSSGPPDGPFGVVVAADPALTVRVLCPEGAARADLAVSAEERDGHVIVHLDRHSHVHDDDFAQRAAGHLRRALETLAATPSPRVGDVDVLTEAERHEVVERFNATRRDYPRDIPLHELFAEQVALGPERIAVVHERTTMTYRALDERVRALETVLRRRGVRRHDRVAFLIGKVPEMVIATLAILRAGAAYVPVDPEYPPDRRDFLLADSGARLLLTIGPAPATAAGIETVDVTAEPGVADTVHDGDEPVRAGDGAYVMYTSGTTGRPKGVLISHRAVARLVKNTDFVPLSPDTRILQTGAVVFDATTFELWGALLNGGTLVLVPDHTILDSGALRTAIESHGITTMWLTAPLFHQLADQDPTIFTAPLRHLLVGGDVLSPRHIAKTLDACPDLCLINGYGPTENTTFSTTHPIERGHTGSIPIGRPIANSTAYVLDLDGRPQPVGVPGELHVGGDGVGEGYLNQPELTRRAFVPDPFVPGGRLYRTGDIVRWSPGGTIEFLGRADGQLKIRGFRVEPGEVEKHLLRVPGIREATVLVRSRAEGVEKYLCAYFTAEGRPTARELRLALRRRLPAYMVPSAFVRLDAMPLNRNGKIDRAALAEIEGDDASPSPGQAPDGETERRLAESWAKVLRVDRIGATDNLFDLGVTSLTAARLVTLVREEFGVRLSLARVLANPTVRAVAALLRARDAGGAPPVITAAPRRPLYPLTAQQRGLYLEQQKDTTATQYNVPLVIDVPGGVDPARLENALRQVVARHASLRTEFVEVGSEILQRVRLHAPLTLAALPDAGRAADQVAAFIRPFDLTAAPLMRAGVSNGPDGSRIVLDFHHLVVDAVTLGVLLDEVEALYGGGRPAEPGLQYTDYTVWHTGEEGARRRAEQERFWARTFAAPPPVADLATDFPRPSVRSADGARVEFSIGEPRTELLRALSRDLGVTLFHTLVAVYLLFLARVTGRRELTVGTPVAGRVSPELERVAGLFAGTICLRATAAPGMRFADFAQAVSRHVIEAFANQDYPFDLLAERVAGERDYARNPLFDTMIALQDTGLHAREFLGGRVSLADTAGTHSMFDLNLQLYQVGRSLDAVWAYSSRLFLPQTVRSYQTTLLDLMDAVVAAPDGPVDDLISAVVTSGATPLDIEFDFSDPASQRAS